MEAMPKDDEDKEDMSHYDDEDSEEKRKDDEDKEDKSFLTNQERDFFALLTNGVDSDE